MRTAVACLIALTTVSLFGAAPVRAQADLVGRRVRVQAPELGSGWHEAVFNRRRTEPACYLVLVLRPRASRTAAIEIAAPVGLKDLERLAVFTGPASPMQDWAGRIPTAASEKDWREIDVDVLRSGVSAGGC